MKLTKMFVLSLVLTTFIGLPAEARKTIKDKKKKVAEKVDTCSVDTFSYAIGLANTDGLKNYLVSRMGVDMNYMNDFLKGFDADWNSPEAKKALAYSAGIEIRKQVEQQIIPQINKQIAGNDSVKTINEKLFVEAFRNGFADQNTNMSLAHAQNLAQKQMVYYQNTLTEKRFGANRKAGEEFLKANKKAKGVKTLPCGVQYKVLQEGKGEIPTAAATVKVHYEGRLIDGTVFDSSYKRNEPAVFGCNQVIEGWKEVLTHMPVGSKWEVFIPQELGYGAKEAGKIPPFSALIFTVELQEIVK